MAATPVRPTTWTGAVRLVVVPSPSSPKKLSPHAQTVPSDSSARLCPLPPAMATTLVGEPGCRGYPRSVGTPSPSCPYQSSPHGSATARAPFFAPCAGTSAGRSLPFGPRVGTDDSCCPLAFNLLSFSRLSAFAGSGVAGIALGALGDAAGVDELGDTAGGDALGGAAGVDVLGA